MVNTEKFAARLEKILHYYDLSAASFADQIEVGRSSISHILSGRNKPSLDFVMKIVKNFPEVELYWLLNGKGNFPATPETESIKKQVTATHLKPEEHTKTEIKNDSAEAAQPVSFNNKKGKDIKRIVIFYADGSFEAFEN